MFFNSGTFTVLADVCVKKYFEIRSETVSNGPLELGHNKYTYTRYVYL